MVAPKDKHQLTALQTESEKPNEESHPTKTKDDAATLHSIVPAQDPSIVPFDNPEPQPDTGSASFGAAVFNVVNSIIGAGILSTPLVFSWNGLGLQLVLLAISAITMTWTATLLVRCSLMSGLPNYRAVVTNAMSTNMARILLLAQCGTMTGALSAYMVLIGDFSVNVLSDFGYDVNRITITLIIGFGIVLPLCLLKSVNALRFTSFIAFTFILYYVSSSTVDSIVQGITSGTSDSVELASPSWQIFRSIPITLFGFQCHVLVLPIFAELKSAVKAMKAPAQQSSDSEAGETEKHEKEETEEEKKETEKEDNAAQAVEELNPPPCNDEVAQKAKRMIKVLTVAFAICSIMYLFSGIGGYLRWGTRIDTGNILNVYADYENELALPAMFTIAQIFFLFIIVFSFPLLSYALRIGLEDLLFPGKEPYYPRAAVLSIISFLIALFIAFVVSDVSIVFGFVGSVASPLTSTIFPCLSFFFLSKKNGKLGFETTLAIFVVIVGILLGILGVYFTIQDL